MKAIYNFTFKVPALGIKVLQTNAETEAEALEHINSPDKPCGLVSFYEGRTKDDKIEFVNKQETAWSLKQRLNDLMKDGRIPFELAILLEGYDEKTREIASFVVDKMYSDPALDFKIPLQEAMDIIFNRHP